MDDGVLIIGAGLAGLSCAVHLGGARVLEKEGEVGGLCRSRRLDGFTFDYTGHLLHLSDPGVRALVEQLLPGVMERHRRRAFILSHGRRTRYPFQANLHGLPDEVIAECLQGLREAEVARKPEPPVDSFEDWAVALFGRGIARHFMLPYNRKLWRVPPGEMTADWTVGMVPTPTVAEAELGARDPEGVTMGYNASFLYPREGGIEVLPRKLAAAVSGVHLGREVVEIDARRRRVACADGSHQHYERLVSTIPLPLLVRRLISAPPRLASAAEELRHVSVWDLNLGISRESVDDAHWVYVPGTDTPFYRVGFPSNLSPSLAPPGCSSLSVEVAHLPDEPMPPSEVIERSLAGLETLGLLEPGERPRVVDLVHIPHAYVLYDRPRRTIVPAILEYLRSENIHSIGRYGAWEYSAMENAILAGRRTADLLRGDRA